MQSLCVAIPASSDVTGIAGVQSGNGNTSPGAGNHLVNVSLFFSSHM